MLLPQNHIELRPPTLVQLAEARVAIALRVPLPVFLPQQLQGHILTAVQLLVDRSEVGWRTRRVMLRDAGFPPWEHHRFYPGFVPIFGKRPSDARRLGPLQVLVNGAHPDRATSPDLLVAQF